jgi:hypothetical protein
MEVERLRPRATVPPLHSPKPRNRPYGGERDRWRRKRIGEQWRKDPCGAPETTKCRGRDIEGRRCENAVSLVVADSGGGKIGAVLSAPVDVRCWSPRARHRRKGVRTHRHAPSQIAAAGGLLGAVFGTRVKKTSVRPHWRSPSQDSGGDGMSSAVAATEERQGYGNAPARRRSRRLSDRYLFYLFI